MSTTSVVLGGSRRFHRAGSVVEGRANPDEWCEITIKLRRAAPLPASPAAQGAPSLTRASLAANHGAPAGDFETVTRVLGALGITVVSQNPAARSLRATGTVEAMERAFDVHLLRVTHEDQQFRGRVGDIHLPKELDEIVTGVFGLDNRRMVRPRRSLTTAAVPQKVPAPAARPWFFPQELAKAYRFPAGRGAGQTIGLIELGGQYVPGDLEAFASATGMPKIPKVVSVEAEPLSARDKRDPDLTGEVMLDIEVAAALCPDATIVAYFSNFTEKGWVDVLDTALHDTTHRPSVLSISWGLAEGEEIWTGQAMSAINDALHDAATLGIPVCVASGDDGSSDQVRDGRAYVDFPSSSPFVLCVGGTALKKHASTETTWKDGDGLRADGGGSTGGGVSTFFDRPEWQSAVEIRSVNPGAILGRTVPDVAANAAGSTGYFMVSGGQGQVSGGTSAAAPLWAAFLALLNEKGKQINYPTPLLYKPNPLTSGRPLGEVACKSITHGNNDTAAAGGYRAGTGYDAVTGWGSPDGAKWMELVPPLANAAE